MQIGGVALALGLDIDRTIIHGANRLQLAPEYAMGLPYSRPSMLTYGWVRPA